MKQSWLGSGAVEEHSCPAEKLGVHLSTGENGTRIIAVNYLASVNIDVCKKVFQPFFFPRSFGGSFKYQL